MDFTPLWKCDWKWLSFRAPTSNFLFLDLVDFVYCLGTMVLGSLIRKYFYLMDLSKVCKQRTIVLADKLQELINSTTNIVQLYLLQGKLLIKE